MVAFRAQVSAGVEIEKNGPIGLREYYYHASILTFRARIGSLKKRDIMLFNSRFFIGGLSKKVEEQIVQVSKEDRFHGSHPNWLL